MTNRKPMWKTIYTAGICLALLTIASSCSASDDSRNTSDSQKTSQSLQSAPRGSQGRAGAYDLVVKGDHKFWTEYPDIMLEPGDKVVFDATGKILWDAALRSEKEVGPEGASWTPSRAGGSNQFLLVDFPIAALMGQVGDTVFGIGKHAEITIKERGVLHLGMNERWRKDCWDDNQGSFQVHVVVK